MKDFRRRWFHPHRWALIAVVALIATGAPALVGAGSTSAAAARSTERVVNGTIAVPTGAPTSTDEIRCTASDVGVGLHWKIDSVVPGRSFELTADEGSWTADFDIAFYRTGPICVGGTPVAPIPVRNFAGDERGVVPEGATLARVVLVAGTPGAAFTYREFDLDKVHFRSIGERKPTVVAIIEGNGFRPYHFDFVGHQHPWNNNENLDDDIDFDGDPAHYIPDYPGAEPVQLTLPGPDDADKFMNNQVQLDAAAWASMKPSPNAASAKLYRFPGTKIVATTRFTSEASGSTYSTTPHGFQTSSVAAGNLNGTCPECVLVLLTGDISLSMEWATKQSWIDVISMSMGTLGNTPSFREKTGDVTAHTLAGVQAGQTIAVASSNGVEGAMVVPETTYTYHAVGADWMVTVGAVSGEDEQSHGSGRPADIVSYGSGYTSAGGSTATSRSPFAGTSNATPVVAGTFARVIQMARELLGDKTPGHADGIVASGKPRPCEGPVEKCPLEDGVLNRAELQSVVFENVLPSPPRRNAVVYPPLTTPRLSMSYAASTPYAFVQQGHGIVHGRKSQARYEAEQRRFLDVLRGAVPSFDRPPGEEGWMKGDSMCRQRLYRTWDEGYFTTGQDPKFDPTTDQAGIAAYAACSQLPQGLLLNAGRIPWDELIRDLIDDPSGS